MLFGRVLNQHKKEEANHFVDFLKIPAFQELWIMGTDSLQLFVLVSSLAVGAI